MDDVDGCTARRTRQANERPAQIGRRVRRLRDVADATGDRARIAPSERDQFNRLAERQQSARQTGNVSPYSGRRRVERAAIDSDAEGLQNGLMNLQVQPPDRPIQACTDFANSVLDLSVD
jgi:hypothetical protein